VGPIRAAAFADLDGLTLYRLLALRVAVFVVDQDVLEQDGEHVAQHDAAGKHWQAAQNPDGVGGRCRHAHNWGELLDDDDDTDSAHDPGDDRIMHVADKAAEAQHAEQHLQGAGQEESGDDDCKVDLA